MNCHVTLVGLWSGIPPNHTKTRGSIFQFWEVEYVITAEMMQGSRDAQPFRVFSDPTEDQGSAPSIHTR